MKDGNGMKPSAGRIILVALAIQGLAIGVYRFANGLGASTALSDSFPWGLWIGFDVLSGVALAAGAFTMAGAAYVFKQYRPILRPSILTGFLGYLLVVLGLLFDLGRPYRIWHPLVMWQHHSVMFEVAWCVMLYLTVLALEFSPAVFEWFGLRRPLKLMHSLTLPLVVAGIILSTLHQSSLGSLFLIVPGKLHPLWYSPFLPLFFYMTALAVGPAMVTVECCLSSRALKRSPETRLLSGLWKFTWALLLVHLALRTFELARNGAIGLAFAGTVESMAFLFEMGPGVVAPLILFVPWAKRSESAGFFASALVVAGVALNRLNVSIVGMGALSGMAYVPSWMELGVSVGLVALRVLGYMLAVEHLPVLSPAEYAHVPAKPERRKTETLKELH